MSTNLFTRISPFVYIFVGFSSGLGITTYKISNVILNNEIERNKINEAVRKNKNERDIESKKIEEEYNVSRIRMLEALKNLNITLDQINLPRSPKDEKEFNGGCIRNGGGSL